MILGRERQVLPDIVFFQGLGDHEQGGAQGFQGFEAILWGNDQPVHFPQGGVDLACAFADIGHWQGGHPCLYLLGADGERVAAGAQLMRDGQQSFQCIACHVRS